MWYLEAKLNTCFNVSLFPYGTFVIITHFNTACMLRCDNIGGSRGGAWPRPPFSWETIHVCVLHF